jgi:hypothetical protein
MFFSRFSNVLVVGIVEEEVALPVVVERALLAVGWPRWGRDTEIARGRPGAPCRSRCSGCTRSTPGGTRGGREAQRSCWGERGLPAAAGEGEEQVVPVVVEDNHLVVDSKTFFFEKVIFVSLNRGKITFLKFRRTEVFNEEMCSSFFFSIQFLFFKKTKTEVFFLIIVISFIFFVRNEGEINFLSHLFYYFFLKTYFVCICIVCFKITKEKKKDEEERKQKYIKTKTFLKEKELDVIKKQDIFLCLFFIFISCDSSILKLVSLRIALFHKPT